MVVFFLRLSYFWGCLHFEVIFISKVVFFFEVVNILRSSSFSRSSSFLRSSSFSRLSSFFRSSSFLRLSSFFKSSSFLRLSSFLRSSLLWRSSSIFSGTYSFHSKFYLPTWYRSRRMWVLKNRNTLTIWLIRDGLKKKVMEFSIKLAGSVLDAPVFH